MNDTIRAVRKSLTLTEMGVIVSLITSSGVGVFTLGVVYKQVDTNTIRLNVIEPKINGVETRIERIDANVEFLTNLAKEERDRHRTRG